MKRIEFIAPVEAMRGNLSGAQVLKYPTQDNKAYDGPLGNVNYARNYTPRFVGAKIASSGQKYFTTRTKSANHLTAKSKHAMALMGGAGAMIAVILRDKSAAVYTGLRIQYLKLQELGSTKTFRKYLSDGLMEMLSKKQASYTFAGPATPVVVQNPWVSTYTLNVPVSQLILFKFWTELNNEPISFKVESDKLLGKDSMNWGDFIMSQFNTIGLTAEDEEINAYIKKGNEYVYYWGINEETEEPMMVYQKKMTWLRDDENYLLTSDAPQS